MATDLRPVVCVRFTPDELAALECGRVALGVESLRQFVHQAALAVGRGFALGEITVVRDKGKE